MEGRKELRREEKGRGNEEERNGGTEGKSQIVQAN